MGHYRDWLGIIVALGFLVAAGILAVSILVATFAF